MTVLVPLLCDYFAAATPGLIHARERTGTDAVCGATGLALVAYRGMAGSGGTGVAEHEMVLPWPPYKAGAGGRPRCHACWEATGKPRPDRAWRGVEEEG